MQVFNERAVVGNAPTGDALSIQKYTLDSGKAGKTFYVQSGIHGGEITQWILHELYLYLEKNLVSGKVILVPNANPVSWLQRVYFSTNGKFDMYMGKDWNRNFPGKADGTLGERISDVLFKAARQADFVLDLHTSRQSLPFSISFRRECLEYAKIFGLKYNQLIDTHIKTSYQDTICAGLFEAGVPSLCIECGSHDAYEAENVAVVLAGIKRLLRHLGMVNADEREDTAQKQIFFEKTAVVRAENGGFIRLAKKTGESVNRGDILYYVYDNNALGKIKTVLSEVSGIVFKISPTHIYWPGDEIVQIISD